MPPRNTLVLDPVVLRMSNDLIAEHLSWLRRVTDREATIRHRHDNLRRLARRVCVPLGEATPEHLDAWQASLTVSRSSIVTYTCHVRAFYRWLHDSGRREDNAAENLPVPKLGKRLPRPIPERHLALAWRCASGDMVVWLALAGWLGLRAGEIARLRDTSVIDEEGGMFLRIDGKGGKERIVPTPPELVPLVRGAMRPGRLFRRPSGQPVTPNEISHEASVYLQSLGLPYVLHQLRHRFGTQHYRLCRDIRQTQELMGHASPATTALYTLVSNAAVVKSMARLGKTLPRRSPRAA